MQSEKLSIGRMVASVLAACGALALPVASGAQPAGGAPSSAAQSSIIAVLVAAAIILVYIMVVFRQVPNPFRYGVCAVIIQGFVPAMCI